MMDWAKEKITEQEFMKAVQDASAGRDPLFTSLSMSREVVETGWEEDKDGKRWVKREPVPESVTYKGVRTQS